MSEDRWDGLARSVGDGRLSRRRALGAFVAGGAAIAVPWAFPRRAQAADCATYCASGGGCPAPNSACCCFETAPGVINVCDCYNPQTQECVYEGGCIVRPKTVDCADGAPRCGDKCCELGEQCCGDKTCCPQADRCCGEICCKRSESCCKDQCCKKNEKCADAIGRKDDVECCAPEQVHRQNGRRVCCPKGTISTQTGCCPPNDKDCCGDDAALGRKTICVRGKIKKI